MSIDDFQKQIFVVAERSPICDSPVIELWGRQRIKIRIELFVGGYVEAYYNQETGTMSYAWIQEGARIFGADNTGGWHIHPFENPADHIETSGNCAVTFAEFIAQIARRLDLQS